MKSQRPTLCQVLLFISLFLVSCSRTPIDKEAVIDPVIKEGPTIEELPENRPVPPYDDYVVDSMNKAEELTIYNAKTTITNPQCGDILSQDVSLQADLDCSSYSGVPLTIAGQGITFNGNGFKIKGKPSAQVVLLSRADDSLISNVVLQGDSAYGIGLLVYNSKNARVEDVTAKNLMLGLDYYSDLNNRGQITFKDNILTDNQFGLRVATDVNLNLADPQIKDCDFSRSQSFAMYMQLKKYTARSSDHNILTDSANGYYLTGTDMAADNLNLTAANISGMGIMVVNTQNFVIQNSNLSIQHGVFAIGLHLYNVRQTTINNVTINNLDVGVKSVVDTNIVAQMQVQNSQIKGHSLAGLMIQSYAPGSYSQLQVQNSNLTLNPSGFAVWVVPGTNLTPSIQNTQL